MEHSDGSAKKPAHASTNEKISELVDGEAEPGELRALIAQLKEGDGRHAWDLYHQIGDAIRSAEPGLTLRGDFSARFSERFSERFAAEPVLLPPRRRLMARLGAWSTTMAAIAAAGFGFFIAPTLMRDGGSLSASGNVALGAAAPASLAVSATAAPQAAADSDDTLAYITLHHRAHASLYGASPVIRPAMLETKSSH